MRWCDAHNHLQDERFGEAREAVVAAARAAGVERMVVNGSCEEDWEAVADLARRHSDLVIPSFGVHPWYVHERTGAWLDRLQRQLDAVPGAVVGEIGIDRWILECPAPARVAVAGHLGTLRAAPLAEQEEVFIQQLALASERGLPASVHCLQAWGRLTELLRTGPRPARGFLLHSYGGSAELVPVLARQGAYFGFPGYFLHGRKARQRAAFRVVPRDRLLVETDAPDQRLPRTPEWREEGGVASDDWRPVTLADAAGGALNHPANLGWVYAGLAEVLGLEPERLATEVAANFDRLFGVGPQASLPSCGT